MHRRDRIRRIVVYCHQRSRRAWSRWRLNGCKIRKVLGPIEFSDELLHEAFASSFEMDAAWPMQRELAERHIEEHRAALDLTTHPVVRRALADRDVRESPLMTHRYVTMEAFTRKPLDEA